MVVTNKMYAQFPVNLMKKLVSDMSAAGSDIRVGLVTSTYTFNQETHNDYADITNEVANGNGYTTTGEALTVKAVTEATRVTTFDASVDTAWAASTITARGAFIYDYETAVAATSPLICFIDFGADVSTTNGTLTLAYNDCLAWMAITFFIAIPVTFLLAKPKAGPAVEAH